MIVADVTSGENTLVEVESRMKIGIIACTEKAITVE